MKATSEFKVPNELLPTMNIKNSGESAENKM
jgi:hypothetical protein